MKKIKNYLALVLCCLILCYTATNLIPTNDEIETYGHYEDIKED